MPGPPLIDVVLDAPVRFIPELTLGLDALDASDRERLVAHLGRVAASRGGLLHTNVAWNALYYGWETDGSGYQAYGVDLEASPPLRHGDANDAVPVGALLLVATGADVLWGEVVYKEGAHPDVNELGEVPPEVSGGAGTESWGASGPVKVLTERLVIDFEAFGRDDRLGARLERFARQGRHLDASGHVVVDTIYAPPNDAEVDDIAFYARWLWRTHREALRDGWLGACLEDAADDEALWAALVGSLRTVDALLDEVAGLAAWGAYRYEEAAYRARLADPDAPLGASDARTLTTSLASPGRARVAYRTMRHRLVDLLGPGEAELHGSAYPLAVCHANRMVGDVLADAAPGGMLVRAGAQVHLRLDDAWQSGGIWRVERLEPTSTCALVDVDPTRPLGLGASGEVADVHVALPMAEAEPEAQAEAEAPELELELEEPEALEESDVADSHVHWCSALRRSHHLEGVLPVPEVAGLVDGGAVVRLAHDGDITDDERVQTVRIGGAGRRLEGLSWPFDFFPGIRLWCIAAPGSRVLHLATAPLAEPVEVNGTAYWFALDPSVLDPRRPAPSGDPTLLDLAVRVLRRHGEPDAEGRLALSTAAMARCLFGPDADEVVCAALDAALSGERAGGRVAATSDGRYAVEPVRQGRARPAGSPFADADTPTWAGTQRLARGVRSAHWVPLHLRRLAVSAMASAERRALYPRMRAQAPNRHLLPAELPRGYTFVVEHRRGR